MRFKCPFCKTQTAEFSRQSVSGWAIECQACHARGPIFFAPSYTSKKNWLLRLKAKAERHWLKSYTATDGQKARGV